MEISGARVLITRFPVIFTHDRMEITRVSVISIRARMENTRASVPGTRVPVPNTGVPVPGTRCRPVRQAFRQMNSQDAPARQYVTRKVTSAPVSPVTPRPCCPSGHYAAMTGSMNTPVGCQELGTQRACQPARGSTPRITRVPERTRVRKAKCPNHQPL